MSENSISEPSGGGAQAAGARGSGSGSTLTTVGSLDSIAAPIAPARSPGSEFESLFGQHASRSPHSGGGIGPAWASEADFLILTQAKRARAIRPTALQNNDLALRRDPSIVPDRVAASFLPQPKIKSNTVDLAAVI